MDRTEVSESIAERFTRVMNATPAPLGVLSDLGAATVLAGMVVTAGFFAVRRAEDTGALYAVLVLAAVPLVVSMGASFWLRDSRERVVEWLTSLPFPIENMNTLLAGLGDTIEVVFAPGVPIPSRAELQPELDRISDDMLVTGDRPDEGVLQIRLGIIDSKRLPLRSNHERWKRLVALVEQVVIPHAKSSPVVRIYVV